MTKPVAIGDPIESLFNLSEDVARAAPRLRRDFLWGGFVSLFFLAVMLAVVGLFVALAVGSPPAESVAYVIATLIAMPFCYAAVRGLFGMWNGGALLNDFLRKHKAILAVRDMNPVVQVPPGETVLSRFAHYLKTEDSTVRAVLSRIPGAWQSPLEVRIDYGRSIRFDIGVVEPGSWLYRVTGVGRPGWTMLVREVSATPTLRDIDQLEEEARIAGEKLGSNTERLVFLSRTEGVLPDSVYDRLVGPPRVIRRGLTRRPLVTSVVAETPDGTYDITPRIVDVV